MLIFNLGIMRFLKPVISALVLGAAADWTTTVYDVIVVGAGPAGIIGIHSNIDF